MKDFLINQEEVRISEFAKPALEAVAVTPVKEHKTTVSTKRKKEKFTRL